MATRSSWTPSVVMILVVIMGFSSFDGLSAKKSPVHSPAHSPAPSHSPVPAHSPPVPAPEPVSPEPVPEPGPAPGPSGPDCVDILTIAIDCVDYLTPGNTSSDPGAACCNETNQLLNIQDGGYCLCELLANPDASPLPVSVTQAWKLPNRCGLRGSPAALCAIIGIHVTAPPGIAPAPAPVPSVSPGPSANPPSPPASPPPGGAASSTSIGLFTLAFSIASAMFLSSHMFF